MDRFHAGARAALWMQLLVGICRGCCSWPRAQHGEAEARGIYCAEQLQPCWLQPGAGNMARPGASREAATGKRQCRGSALSEELQATHSVLGSKE